MLNIVFYIVCDQIKTVVFQIWFIFNLSGAVMWCWLTLAHWSCSESGSMSWSWAHPTLLFLLSLLVLPLLLPEPETQNIWSVFFMSFCDFVFCVSDSLLLFDQLSSLSRYPLPLLRLSLLHVPPLPLRLLPLLFHSNVFLLLTHFFIPLKEKKKK